MEDNLVQGRIRTRRPDPDLATTRTGHSYVVTALAGNPSQADGIFLIPAYRGSPMAEMMQQVRSDLPALREVVSFADWEAFCAEAAPDRALPEVSPHAPAQIQYTSGTTGFPKGAVLHHRGIVNNARLHTARLGVGPGSVQLSAMPLFHTAGCVMSVLGAVVTRGRSSCRPTSTPP